MKRDIHEDASLFRKGLLGETTEEEQQKLEKLLENASLHEIYDQLKTSSFLKEQFDAYKNYSSKEGYRKFCLRVGRKNEQKRFVLRWGSVAAVMLLVLTISFWLVRDETRPSALPKKIAMISAGGKKAQLTLADGRVIPVMTKEISLQEKDGTEISYKDGTLCYHKGEKGSKLIFNELNVPMGGESFLVLADGTKVWLNAGTKLRYLVSFVGESREVYLEGEAYFDVVKDELPFVVKTSFGEVNVLGTAFGVEAYTTGSECFTTLVRGKVSFTTEEGHPLVIVPGEQVIADKSGGMRKRTVNPEEYVGWKDGLYVFKEKSLGEIMNTLERWYDISVSFREQSLRDIPFTGNLKRYDSIEQFLDALTRTGDIRYEIEGKQVILFK